MQIVFALATVLPHPAVLFLGLASLAGDPQQVRLLERQKIVARKPRTERACDLQSLAITVFAAQEDHEHGSGIHAGFAVGVVGIVQILKSLFLVAAQADERDSDLRSE